MNNNPQIEKITPAMAQRMMKLNTHNLPMIQSHVDYLAGEMAAGHWTLNHQGIAFSGDILIDGQHRLAAVIQSGVTVEMWVFRGCTLGSQYVVDKGRIRRIHDELAHFGGVKYAKQKAAACRTVARICCSFQNIKMSTAMVERILNDMGKEIEQCVELSLKFKNAQHAWILGPFAFILSCEPKLIAFISSVCSGENLTNGDPAKALRDWLINNSTTRLNGYKGPAIECVFNAAYNFLTGSKITQIKRSPFALAFFINRKAGFVQSIRSDFRHQIGGEIKE